MAKLSLNNRLRPLTKTLLKRKMMAFASLTVLSLAALVLWHGLPPGDPEPIEKELFLFSPREDALFENPANWSPHYPGNVIRRQQQFVIEGTVYLTGFGLEIQGSLLIPVGAALYAAGQEIVVSPSGELVNDGEIMAGAVRNQGRTHNNLSASIDVERFYAEAGAYTHNAPSAHFVVRDSAVNYGIFNNHSLCSVGETFINAAIFYQMPRSELRVKGIAVEVLR